MTERTEWDNLVDDYTEKVISPFYSTESTCKFVNMFPAEFAGAILDLGCGKGYLISNLEKRYGDSVKLSATDISFDMLNSFSDNKFSVCQSSASNLPFFDKCYNLVTAVNSIIMDDPVVRENSFKEIKRVLKPSGKLIALFPSNENHYEQLYHLKKQYQKDGDNENDAINKVYEDINERLFDPIGGYVNIQDFTLRIKLYSKFELEDILNEIGFVNISIEPFRYPDSMVQNLNLTSGSNGIYDWFVTASVK